MGFKIKKKKSFFNRFASVGKIDMLSDAIDFFNARNWSEAFELSEKAVKTYPDERRFWEIIAVSATHLGNVSSLQRAYGKLVALDGTDSEALFGLAHSYGMGGRVALAVRTFRQFLEKFPFDSKVENAVPILKMCEKDLEGILAAFDLPNHDEGLKLACLHEKAQILMHQNNFETAIKTSEELISKKPDFAPAYNNLSLIYYLDDQYQKAAEIAEKVLDLQPDNFHALGNLAKFNFILGKFVEADKFSVRLQNAKSDNPLIYLKKVEILAYLGNDEAVVKVCKEFQKRKIELPESKGFFKHLAAFSFLQLGNEKEAKKLWQQAIKEENGEFAEANLEEFNFPAYERNFFSFPLNYWISGKTFAELSSLTLNIKEHNNFEQKLKEKIRQFFSKNPNVLSLLSNILERADIRGKEFAVKLIEWSNMPEALEILKNFALGQKCSDSIRYHAAMSLAQADYISTKVNLWREGEQTEIILLCFQVFSEGMENKDYPFKNKTYGFYEKALKASHQRNFTLAKQYYEMALNIQPNHPSLIYNMISIRKVSGENVDERAELETLVERFPDYTFASLSLALQYLEEKRLAEAENLVSKFHDQKEWHVTEITLWCRYNMELLIEKENYTSAKSWFEVLKKFDDINDHSDLEEFFERAEIFGPLRKLLKKSEESKAKRQKRREEKNKHL